MGSSLNPQTEDAKFATSPLRPATGVQLVHAQVDVDLPKFTKMFGDLMSAPTPARVRPEQ